MSISSSEAVISVRRSSREALGDLAELLLDQAQDALLVAEDGAQLLDALDDVRVLAADLVGLERRELRQAQVEDRRRLQLRELEARHQLGPGALAIARGADELDHRVEVVDRDEQALEDVRAALLLGQLVLRAPDDDLALVRDVGRDDLLERQRARDAVDQRDHVHAEGRLHGRVLVELVEDDLRQRSALELDDQPHTVAVGLVTQVADVRDLLVVDEVGDLRDQPAVAALLHGERELGDDQRLLALADLLDAHAGAHAHAASAGLVGVTDPGVADDDAAGREVGPLDVAHELVVGDVRVVDVGDDRIGDLAQVVRRDVGRHADRDAGRAVDEQVREARRQDQRLLVVAVVGRGEVDRVLVEVAQHLHRQAREPRLRVAHGRRGVVVDGAEVPLPVDERVAHGEVLRHAHERVVDRRVAVRVVLAHHVADDRGALRARARRPEALLAHRVEHPPVHGLQPVAHVGQRAPDDDGHRVVEVRRAHLVLERARLDVAPADDVGAGHLDHHLRRRRSPQGRCPR